MINSISCVYNIFDLGIKLRGVKMKNYQYYVGNQDLKVGWGISEEINIKDARKIYKIMEQFEEKYYDLLEEFKEALIDIGYESVNGMIIEKGRCNH